MTRIHRITLSSLAAVWSTCSYATFHFWEITEVYSNADGSIQFIELFTGQPGQEFVAGQTLTASDASGETHTFRFPRNLPAPTTGRHFLLATPAFASVSGGVVPDFEIPAGFIAAGSGVLRFIGADTFVYTDLPDDGIASLDDSNRTADNSPTNFAGRRGFVVDPGSTTPQEASFSFATGLLTIPYVTVGTSLFSAELAQVAPGTLEFRLQDAQLLDQLPAGVEPSSYAAGLVTIPRVNVSTLAYRVTLRSTSVGDTLHFVVETAELAP